MTLDRAELRRAFGCFVTGVTVATTIDPQGAPRGFTANSFASVSLDPPLLLVCVARSAGVYPVFRDAAAFAVNILRRNQRDVSARFATERPDKFADLDWVSGETGSPVLIPKLSERDSSRSFRAKARARFALRHEAMIGSDHQVLVLGAPSRGSIASPIAESRRAITTS